MAALKRINKVLCPRCNRAVLVVPKELVTFNHRSMTSTQVCIAYSPLAPNLQELGQIQKKQPEGITAGPKGEDMLVWEGAITGEVRTMPPRLLDRDVTRRSPQSDLDAAAVGVMRAHALLAAHAQWLAD
jgi:hypothetical protein